MCGNQLIGFGIRDSVQYCPSFVIPEPSIQLLTSNDIDDYKNKKDEKTPFSIDDFNADITQIKSLFDKDGNVMLTSKEAKEYKKLIKKIGSLFIA